MSFRRVFRDARYVLADLADGVLSMWESEAVKRAYGAAEALADKEAEEEVAEPRTWCSHGGCTTCFPDDEEDDAACPECPRPSHPGACEQAYDDEPIGYSCIQCGESYQEGERCSCFRNIVSPVAPSAGSPLSPPPTVDSEGPAEDVPPTPSAGHPNVIEAIEEVLENHRLIDVMTEDSPEWLRWGCFHAADHRSHVRLTDPEAWREHVAPIIAAAVRVSAALTEREERLTRRADRLNGGPY